MRVFLDASVAVPLFVAEASSAALLERIIAFAPVASHLVLGEASAAFVRKVKDRELAAADLDEMLAALDEWAGEDADIVEVTPGDVRMAAAFVRRPELHLRMPDAIHLAVCRRLALPLLTGDRAMARAAEALGVALAA